MVRSVTRDLPELGKNNQAVNQTPGNGGQKMSQYSWFTVYLLTECSRIFFDGYRQLMSDYWYKNYN